jgi:TonB family protein
VIEAARTARHASDAMQSAMSTARHPPTPDTPPRNDFEWPPSTDELDAIEVIMLPQGSQEAAKTDAMRQAAATTTDDVSRTDITAQAPAFVDARMIERVSHRPSTDTRRHRAWANRLRSLDRCLREFRLSHLRVLRMRIPQVHVPRMRLPRVAMPRVSVSRVSVPGASGFIAAVMVARSSRRERQNGADVAQWALALTSLAIVVALVLQVSEWRRTSEAANLAATFERETLTAATSTQEPSPSLSHVVAATTTSRMDDSVSLAMAGQEPSMTTMAPGARSVLAAASSSTLTHALPTTSAQTPMSDVRRPARAATRQTPPAMRQRERIDRDDTPWWGRRTRAASSSRPSYSRRAATTSVGVISPPLRLPESYVQPRVVSSSESRRVRGKVVLGVLVRSNGRVGDVNVVSGDVDRDLERAAIAAVKRWRYRPALRDGVPTPARVKVVVNFG